MEYKFIKSNCTDIYWNFALEEYMLDNVNDDEFILYLWRNTPSVLIGRNQNVYAECNLDAMEEDGVKLVRRMSGGGTVYFDLGNVTYSFIAKKHNFSKESNYKLIMNSLKRLGFETERSGRNDILYDGKKISGNAFYHTGDKSLHHGTILSDVDMSKMSKYLNVSKKKLESKGVKSVRSRVVNLKEYDPTLNYDKIVDAFYKEYCENIGTKIDIITNENVQQEKSSHKYYEKHTSKNWQFGKNPEFNYVIEERFDWGIVEIRMLIKENKIKQLKIFTDSLIPDFFEKINDVLVDIDYNKETIIDTISNEIDYKKYGEDIEKVKKDLFLLLVKEI